MYNGYYPVIRQETPTGFSYVQISTKDFKGRCSVAVNRLVKYRENRKKECITKFVEKTNGGFSGWLRGTLGKKKMTYAEAEKCFESHKCHFDLWKDWNDCGNLYENELSLLSTLYAMANESDEYIYVTAEDYKVLHGWEKAKLK